jgi:hypothetical protein
MKTCVPETQGPKAVNRPLIGVLSLLPLQSKPLMPYYEIFLSSSVRFLLHTPFVAHPIHVLRIAPQRRIFLLFDVTCKGKMQISLKKQPCLAIQLHTSKEAYMSRGTYPAS